SSAIPLLQTPVPLRIRIAAMLLVVLAAVAARVAAHFATAGRVGRATVAVAAAGVGFRRRGHVGRAVVGHPDRGAEGAAVRVQTALGAAVAVLGGGRARHGAVAVLERQGDAQGPHRNVATPGIVLLDEFLDDQVGGVARAAGAHRRGRELVDLGRVRQVAAVPGGVGVVILRMPGVAVADVAPLSVTFGARPPEAGEVIVRAAPV